MSGTAWPSLVAIAKAKASEVEAKFDWLEQHIVPMSGGTKTDNTYDLGETAFRWRNVYASTALANGQGSSLNFPAADQISLETNSTTALAIDSAGIVTKPLQPCFEAFLISSSAIWTATQTAIVPFNYSVLNVGTNFSTSTYKFTAPVNGTYKFDLKVRLSQMTSTVANVSTYLKISSNSYLREFTGSGTSNWTGSIEMSALAYMSIGTTAYAEISVDNLTNGLVLRSAVSDWTSWFTGHLVG